MISFVCGWFVRCWHCRWHWVVALYNWSCFIDLLVAFVFYYLIDFVSEFVSGMCSGGLLRGGLIKFVFYYWPVFCLRSSRVEAIRKFYWRVAFLIYWERFLGNTEKVVAFEVVGEIVRTRFEVCDACGFFSCWGCMLRAFMFLSCGRSISALCEIWLLLVVLVAKRSFW